MKVVSVSRRRLLIMASAMALILATLITTMAFAQGSLAKPGEGRWLSGDFHTHTYLTDGSHTETDVVSHAFDSFHLDWMANSEHGGAYNRDPQGTPWTSSSLRLPTTPVNADGKVWRWITLRDYSFPIIEQLRNLYPRNNLIQGLEWNVPTHEHASVGIVNDEPKAISDFEYMFDASDKDTSRASEGLIKDNTTHQSAVDGAAWLEKNCPDTSYFLLNHPSRALKYSIADIRDFNNAAPDVAFGFEGIPGHQKESARGGYGNSNPKARTYGGADYMIAEVGGLWDALLGEGRHFWAFVNSDFHRSAAGADFYPGEYAKSYTYVTGEGNKAIVDGMRSGNSFMVHGDLINALDFTVRSKDSVGAMGADGLTMDKGDNALVKIRFKSPEKNNNGGTVKVDHIDLIAGDVTGMAQPGTDAYSKDTNESARVIATFTDKDWEYEDGWYTISYPLKDVARNQYFRLRGTNLAPNMANETDGAGNPLIDDLVGSNTAQKAWADLWFYSNPVFVTVN